MPDYILDTFNFSKYVGLDPVSTLYPKKYKEYQAYQIHLKFSNSKNIFQICTLTLKKPQIDINDPPKKRKKSYFHHTSKDIYFSAPLPPPKKNVIQVFELPKMDQAYLYMIISECHIPPPQKKKADQCFRAKCSKI